MNAVCFAAAASGRDLRAVSEETRHSSCVRRPQRRRRPRGSALRCSAETDDSSSRRDSDEQDSIVRGDWREFRARLCVKEGGGRVHKDGSWCHALPRPEAGCVLVANPAFFRVTQQYFKQAVILLLAHDKNGSHGIILNKRLALKLGQLLKTSGGFAENKVHLGGDVGDDTYIFLHGYGHIGGSEKVVDGVYQGGYREIAFAAEEGSIDPAKVKIFNQYCGWAPSQLEFEVDRQVWFPAACSASLILEPDVDLSESKPLWRQIMRMLGGEYTRIMEEMS